MMGTYVRGDNLKRRLRIAKRLTCLMLAGFLCISAAVVPYAQALPAETQAPAVTVVSTELPKAYDIMQTVPVETETPTPSEPAVTDSPAVTSAPEASGDIQSEPTGSDIPAVTDSPDVTVNPQPDVTDVSDITGDSSDTTSDTSDISDILDGEIDPEESFVDENGVMFFTLARGGNGIVSWKVAVNSSGYYTLLVEGNGEVPSNILSQPDVAPYRNLISKVQIKNGVTSIGENAFRGLPGLTEVRFEDNSTLTSISNGAFADCGLLTNINLESCHALTSIGNTERIFTTGQQSAAANEFRATGAFSNTGLANIVIPASLQNLGHYTFYGCKSLTDVCFEANSQNFTFGACVFENCSALKNVNLEALSGNIITNKVDILEKYSQGLFYNCDSLESITIPSGFGYNGSPLVAMFNNCDNIKSITFEENHNITGVNNQIDNIISGSTRNIAILDLRNLVSLTEIGEYSIRGEKLSIVYLPASVKTLGTQPFGDCKSLTAVVFPENSELTTIGSSSFNNDDNLVSVNLENTKVETIGNYAFQNDHALTEIAFPATLNEIRWYAFENCTSLSKINYNAVDLTFVDNTAFNGVTSKINVHVGTSVQTINESFLSALNGHMGEFTFAPNANFTVAGNETNLAGYDTPFKTAGTYSTDANGNLYKVDGASKTLVMANKDSSGIFTVPADVTGIAAHAFKDCSGITAINFENINSISALAEYAFADCVNLANLTAAGYNTTEEVKAALEGKCTTGSETLFVNTKLSGSTSGDGIGGTKQTASYKFNEELTLSATQYDNTLLTGDVWTVHLALSNQNLGNVYRVYFKYEDGYKLEDPGKIGLTESSIPNIYYYEVKIVTGDTVQRDTTISYPNGTAPGKKVQVWAVQGKENSFITLGNKVVYPKDGVTTDGITADGRYLQMEWITEPKTHSVTKSNRDSNNLSFEMRNGQPTLTNLNYDIAISFAGNDTSNHGMDNSIAAEYRDVMTLPDKLKWVDGLQQAIESGAYNYTIKNENNGDNKSAKIYVTIGGKEYVVCSLAVGSASSLNFTGFKLEWDPTANAPAIIWQVRSKDNKSQLHPSTVQMNVGDIIVGNTGFETLKPEDKLIINNKVNTKVTRQFSADENKSDTCSVEVFKSPAKLSLSKDILNAPAHLGEDVQYRITLDNNTSVDATARNLSKENDALVVHDGLYPTTSSNEIRSQYIKPENIEKLFNNTVGASLKVEISQATLTNMNVTGTQVNTVDGEDTALLTPQNTANVTNNYDVSKVDPKLTHEGRIDTRECSDDENVITKNAKITIIKDDNNIKVTVNKGDGIPEVEYSTAGSKTLKQIFDEIGYIVTRTSKYDLYWTYPADYSFAAGSSEAIEYTATVKDTFMYTPYDKPYYYNYGAPVYISAFNNVQIDNPADGAFTKSSAEVSVDNIAKDLEVGKDFSVNGVKHDKEKDKIVISDNDELEYTVNIKHNGTGSYDVLPCVDSMVGPQVLLAEVAKNPSLEGRGLPIYKYKSNGGEIKCYVLNQPGTYNGVWLGDYFADSVTVSKPGADEGDGLKTVIKWYFKDTIPRDFDMNVRYKALISTAYSGAANPDSYKLDNSVWLNDHPEHRIFDYVGVEGSVVQFNKIAIKKNGNLLPAEQQTGCPVGKGNEITYRLDFSIRGNAEQILTKNNIYDVLPSTGGQFEWTKENVKISYGSNGKTHPETSENLVSIKFDNADLIANSNGAEWDIETTTDGQYQIKWKDGFNITLGNPGDDDNISNVRTAYIYVTLTFPNDSRWDTFYNSIDNKTVINTLHCNGLTAHVTHTLSGSCEAFIQKGVYETGSFGRNAYWGPENYYRGMDREHYAVTLNAGEAGFRSRFIDNLVTYYIVIANTGNTNLYLAPIYDVLPEGFEFYNLSSMVTQNYYYVGHTNKYKKAEGSNQASNDTVECGWGGHGEDKNRLVTGFSTINGENVTLLNPKVKVVDAEQKIGNRQVVKLEVIEGNADYDFPNIDNKGKFLKPNEAIQFGITCITSEDRIDPAENIVTMEYLNYTESELYVDQNTKVNLNTSNGLADHNDGKREDYTSTELTQKIGGELDTVQKGDNIQWLASSVNVTPGDIKPGITKTVEESLYKVENNNVTKDIVWTVSSLNEGTEGITDYKIVDTLDYPLRFEGDFRYQVEYNNNAIYAKNGMSGTNWIMMCTTYPNTMNNRIPKDDRGRWKNLFTIERNNADNSMTIWSNILSDSEEKTTSIHLNPGENKNLRVRIMHRGEGHVEKDINIEFKTTPVTGSNGNTYNQETLIVTFADDVFTIVPDGKSVFDVSSKLDPNAPAQDKIGSFNNTATIVPTQSFTETASEGQLTEYNGSRAVENVAQITTYADSPTSSVKKIEEVGAPDNFGKSNTPLKNTILVDSVEKLAKYTLTVTNGDSAQPMTKLVIIDNLPEPGDTMTLSENTARESDFKVSLAEDPKFVVTVTSEDGTSKKLSSDKYTIDYRENSNYAKNDISVSPDWMGEPSSEWSNSPTNARTFRVVITEQINAGDRVDISFEAKLADDAKPGQIAWNSFGYCFETMVTGNTGSTWLYAAPLKVGVGLPALPDIQKRCAIKQGDALVDYAVESDETFNFFIFAGASPVITDYSVDGIAKALNDASIQYATFPLTVKAGQSLSDKLSLADIAVPEGWKWKIGAKYTIIEAENADYINQPVIHTFTYERKKLPDIVVENIHSKSIELTKVDKTDNTKVLEDAVFGLYTTVEAEKMSDEEIMRLATEHGLTLDSAKTIVKDGKTYYLYGIAATDINGKITFERLAQEDYLIKELKAPQGYYVIPVQSEQICDLTASGSLQQITIANRKKALMPATGGQGSGGIVALGALLVLIAAGAYAVILRRRISGRNM